jgi:hypothetical protein
MEPLSSRTTPSCRAAKAAINGRKPSSSGSTMQPAPRPRLHRRSRPWLPAMSPAKGASRWTSSLSGLPLNTATAPPSLLVREAKSRGNSAGTRTRSGADAISTSVPSKSRNSARSLRSGGGASRHSTAALPQRIAHSAAMGGLIANTPSGCRRASRKLSRQAWTSCVSSCNIIVAWRSRRSSTGIASARSSASAI